MDGAGLHLGDFGIHDAETAAAETEHGIELVEFLDALFDLRDGHAHLLGEVVLRGVLVGEELVQRRVEEADGGREALQRLEDADEVALLEQARNGKSSCLEGVPRRSLLDTQLTMGSLAKTAIIDFQLLSEPPQMKMH